MKRLIFLTIACLISSGGCSENLAGTEDTDSTEFIWPPAAEINASIGRAINLGNALEAPAEGEWGVTLQEEYFEVIDSAGFDAVRIPVRWSAHANVDSPYVIDEQFFRRVDWAVENAVDRNLVAIINIHHFEEIMTNPAANKARFLSLWRQIADRYSDYLPQLIFEILNEPNDQLTPDLWNRYLLDAYSIIRESNPKRALIIGTANWGGLGSLEQLEIPEEDEFIIVTFHYYEPFPFTHQGAEWVEGSDAWLNTEWTGNSAEIEKVRADFDRAAEWADSKGVSLFMGEFGAYSRAGLVSRVRWTNCIAREAESRGFSWAYWEFCSGFGVYDSDTGTWNKYLLEALIPEDQTE